MGTEQEIFDKYGREYQPGNVIFREGDTGNEMFIIQSGRVRITKNVKGEDTTLVELGSGDFFGEMAVIDKEPRSANAIAVESSRLIALDEEVFEMHMQTNPKIVKKILKNLTQRLRNSNLTIANLLIKDTNLRVANTLLREAQRAEAGPDGVVVSMNVESLNKACGLELDKTREAVSKMLKARVVRATEPTISVANVDSLEKYIKYLEMKEQFGE
jgi:CRP/FNR family cyclic AMP-dependent transcriptional regulator